MLLYIGQVIWFFFPAGAANIAASLSRFFPCFNYPVDFGKSFRSKRIFGDHKTWRGLIFGIIFGVLFFWLQQYLHQFDFFNKLSIISYTENDWNIGFLLSLGAVLGDLVKSYFKRRLNITPGKTWVPFDQIDYVVGAILFVSLFYFPGWKIVSAAVLLGFLFHVLVNLTAYIMKLQDNKL
ncbi:MAG: CDP-archaeol synthase [Patescibacteria group bacterium]|jgi:CDP-2,3-bis-(O-geranylgeranyl)-sn-glycerol synthase